VHDIKRIRTRDDEASCETFLYRVKPAACGGESVTCGRPSPVLGAAGAGNHSRYPRNGRLTSLIPLNCERVLADYASLDQDAHYGASCYRRNACCGDSIGPDAGALVPI
jgi:hypothetical protein